MAKQLTPKQKKDLAYSIYMSEDLTQVELAEKVGTSKVSIGKWMKEGKWEETKKLLSISTGKLLKDFTEQLNELHKHIKSKDEGKRYPDYTEMSIQNQLTKSIAQFKGKASLIEAISFTSKFTKHLRSHHPDKVKEITLLLDEFVKELL